MNGGPNQPADDARLAALERTVLALDARLAAIEASSGRNHLDGSHRVDEAGRSADAPPTRVERPGIDAVAVMSFAGRTLMVLGGAYLLRALTESAIWPASVGVGVGFAYAAVWLVETERAARAGRRTSAAFHGAAAVMIALPLLWEAVTRFRLLDAAAASMALTAVASVTLAIAVRARVQTVAWFATIGAVVISAALGAATAHALPFTVADIVLGVVTLWIGYTADWIWLRWPVAFVADVAVIALGVAAAWKTTPSSPAAIVAVQLLLLGAYVASVAIRTLVRGREVIPFEVAQSVVALLAGFGGAIEVAQTTGMGIGLLVSSGIACGVGCYAVAFAFIARRQGVRRNFYFYTSIGLVLILASTAIGVPYPAAWWAGLAVLAARRASARLEVADDDQRVAAPGWLTLAAHAASYLIAAFLASKLMTASFRALVGPPITQSAAAPQSLVVFVAGCLCWVLLARNDTGLRAAYARIPRAVVALLLAIAGSAWLASLAQSDGTTPGNAATTRTIALAAIALALAWLGRAARLREAAWLVYATLAAGGVKLLAEDIPH
ncbi:MAG TPA: hypothetical protein VKE96_23575, partial [Vicinamibacterales bacterium]|nr:hypothetical protein [Vicinamibacterales bacterium]